MNRKGFLQGHMYSIPECLKPYEFNKAKNKSLYLDSDEYADIINYYVCVQQYDKAKQAICDAKSIHPNNTLVSIEEAYFYLEKQEVDTADSVVKQIQDIDQDNYHVILIRADIALEKKDVQLAESILNKIKHKTRATTINDVVYLYIDHKQFDKAKLWLDLGENKYENNEEYLLARADFFLTSNRYNKAEKAFEVLLDINPFSVQYWWGYAYSLFELSRYKDCIEACDFGILIDETFSDLHILKGQTYQQLDLNEYAIDSFNRALAQEGCPDTDLIQTLIEQSAKNCNSIAENIEDARVNQATILSDMNSFYSEQYSEGRKTKEFIQKSRQYSYEYDNFRFKEVCLLNEYKPSYIENLYRDLEDIEEEIHFEEMEEDIKRGVCDNSDEHEEIKDRIRVDILERLLMIHRYNEPVKLSHPLIQKVKSYSSKETHYDQLADLYYSIGYQKEAFDLYKSIEEGSHNPKLYRLKRVYIYLIDIRSKNIILPEYENLRVSLGINSTDFFMELIELKPYFSLHNQTLLLELIENYIEKYKPD